MLARSHILYAYVILNVCIYLYMTLCFHSFKALKKQYPIEDGYRIALRKIFKFINSEAVPLKITVPDDDKYIVQKVPHNLEV